MKDTRADRQTYYICGQCHDKQYYLVGETPPKPCPDCGWNHLGREKYSVPDEFKIPIK